MILSDPVAFVTSGASSTEWNSLTVSVNSDISGEAGALAALPDQGTGCQGRKLMPRRSSIDWLFLGDFQLKILTAHWVSGCTGVET